MVQLPNLRILMLYFAAMTVIHGVLLYRSANDIAIGLPDFCSFYTAGKILRSERGPELYSLKLQEIIQTNEIPRGVKKRGTVLPYTHPPFEAPLFMALAWTHYFMAYWIWFAVNIILLCTVIGSLRRSLPLLGKIPFLIWFLASISFAPIFIGLIQGQDSLLLLLCLSLAFSSLQSRRFDIAAGWLGLAFFKFQIVLPLLLPLAVVLRGRFLKALAIAGTSLALISICAVGPHEVWNYPRFLWDLNRDPSFRPLVGSEGTASLFGLITGITGNRNPKFSGALCLLSSLGFLIVSGMIWKRTLPASPQSRQLAFASAVVIAVLLSYHAWAHDLSVLFLPILVTAELVFSGFSFRDLSKSLIGALSAPFFFSPLLFFLVGHHKLYLLTILMLVLASVLTWEIFRRRPPETRLSEQV